jgi:hypothetical protein
MASKTSKPKTATAGPAGPGAKKNTARRHVARTPGVATTAAAQLPRVTKAEVAAAKAKFEQGILARGEAVKAGTPLPPGATHEIVGKQRSGAPILKRKRFSLK